MVANVEYLLFRPVGNKKVLRTIDRFLKEHHGKAQVEEVVRAVANRLGPIEATVHNAMPGAPRYLPDRLRKVAYKFVANVVYAR